jgi:hypothetical protein
MRPLEAAIALAVTLPLLMAAKPPAHKPAAQSRSKAVPVAVPHAGAPGTITMAGREVLQLQPVGYFTGEDRAVEVLRRIARVIEPENDMLSVTVEPFVANRDVKVGQEMGKSVVQFKGITIATVTPQDEKAAGLSDRQVAQMWANNFKAGLEALNASSRSDEKRVLEQIQAGAGGQTVANGVTGVTDSVVADRIRRGIARDPVLRRSDLNVDVMSDRVIIRNEAASTPREVRRLEQVIRGEAGDRAISEGNQLGTEKAPQP